MLFERRLRDGIEDGSITVAFRRWKRPQVVAGGRYRTGTGMIVEVESVDLVEESAISARDARRAGYASVSDLLADVPGAAEVPLYRLVLHRVAGPDPRDLLAGRESLSGDEIADLDRRLERMDRLSPRGPWTAAVLAAIAARPGERAADLAASFGWEVAPFKVNVRKLKNLGLTVSLDVGYRLSPRGDAYLRATGHAVQPGVA